ncbi:hypothetical protein V6N13_113771 [Hibiscus sabdariffa]|uniref:Uncharacterized protein n=1 Tax=Hibiscus sabdariffa TaxID=183260 RepID=A0ABR2U0H3_9ROSI
MGWYCWEELRVRGMVGVMLIVYMRHGWFSVLDYNNTNPQPIQVVESSHRVRKAQVSVQHIGSVVEGHGNVASSWRTLLSEITNGSLTQSSQVVVIPTVVGSKPLIQNHVPSLVQVVNKTSLKVMKRPNMCVPAKLVLYEWVQSLSRQLDSLIPHEGVAGMAMGGPGTVQSVDTVQADCRVAMEDVDTATKVLSDGRVVSGKENSTPNL